MTYLLDTHVLLWWLADDARLSLEHREIIVDGKNRVLVSSITIAEVSMKASLGKLELPGDIAAVVADQGFDELAFAGRHAAQLLELPWHHRDPFDRMLLAQAQADSLVFLTADARCRQYGVATR